MIKSFTKVKHKHIPGCTITHTKGTDASGSTKHHQHFCLDSVFYYYVCGTSEFRVEGHCYSIQSGDILVINTTELFQNNVDPNFYHERIGFHISNAFFEKIPFDTCHLLKIFVDREKGIGNRIPAEIVSRNGLDKLVMHIHQLVQKNEVSSNLMAFCKLTELLTQLSELSGYADMNSSESTTSSVDHILSYVNAHFTESITLESIAKEFYISPSHLSHIFKDQTGIPLWKYVILRRLQLFNSFVEQGISIEDASRKAGFQNYSNFFRLYKKNMGMTPTEFKRNSRQSKPPD